VDAPTQVQAGVRTGIAETADEGKARSFPCGQCGADLEFNAGAQSLVCPYCGHAQALSVQPDAVIVERDLPAMLDQLARQRAQKASPGNAGAQRKEVRCRACGATVSFDATLTSDACSFCASPIQLDDVHDSPERIVVDGVLPLLVAKERAAAALRAWIESRWFAPSDFKRTCVQGRFESVYLPFWTFDALTFSLYTGERGDEYTVTVGSGKNQRRETRVRWSNVSGQVRKLFDDVLVCALRSDTRPLVHKLEPWPLQQLKPYQPELLAGHKARTYDVELGQGFGEAKQAMEEAIRTAVCRDIGGDRQRIHSLRTDYSALTYKHLLLPVWLLVYRYQNQPYQVAINACTGEVQGERPYSKLKIALAVLLGLVVLCVVWVIGQNE
jgi:DNA-directed RNA polymerase subunit RPC12/RpoP